MKTVRPTRLHILDTEISMMDSTHLSISEYKYIHMCLDILHVYLCYYFPMHVHTQSENRDNICVVGLKVVPC